MTPHTPLWRKRLFTIVLALASGLHLDTALGAACDPQKSCCTTPGGGGWTGGTPACGAQAGNPLNVMNGNKFQTEVDMPALPGVLGLELVRYYNSEYSWPQSPRGILGRGWRLSYDAELLFQRVGLGLTLHQADGTRVDYHPSPAANSPTAYTSAQPGQGILQAHRSSTGVQYTLTLPNQTRQTFNAKGKLIQILAPTGEFVTLQRDAAGFLLRVTDPQGRSLVLHYLDNKTAQAADRFRGVQHIDTPVGRFGYAYGSPIPTQTPQTTTASPKINPTLLLANLVRVRVPTHAGDPATATATAAANATNAAPSAPVQKTYHYEDANHPTLLTGISLQGQGSDGQATNQRLVSWAYDKAGRAVLSVKGTYDSAKAGIEQVSLEFAPKNPDGSGTTILTNSLGQTTRYHYARINGRAQLLEVRGPGCATCGPSNVRYQYDAHGQRTRAAVLDAQGHEISATLTRYDSAGRSVQVSGVSYVNGKAQAPQLQVRYEYAADPANPQPTLVARPSVVPGKEHITRISYNQAGQPTRITEEGFSPLDANGQIANAPASTSTSVNASALSRSTTYSYQTINGRSVLKQVDGPLPNGPSSTPKDSDITTFAYDARADYLVGVTAPGNFQNRYTHDTAGRITLQSLLDGYRQIDTATTYEGLASAARQPQRITRSAWLLAANGQIDSTSVQTLQVLQARFDALGRRTHSTGTDGLEKTLRYVGIHPGTLTNAQGQQLSWAFDSESRLLAQIRQDEKGKVLDGRMWLRDEQNRLRATLTPQGLERIYGHSNQNLPELPDSAAHQRPVSASVVTPTSAPRQQLRDDFDRVVYERHPEDGNIVTVFESTPGAQQQTQRHTSTDGKLQSLETLVFDAGGRLQSRTRGTEGQDRCTETLHYQGQLLIQLQGCGSAQQFERDAFGHITSQTHLVEPGKLQTTQRFTYDANGQLSTRTTSDGQVLRYRYDPQTNNTQAVALQRTWLTFFANITSMRAANQLASWLPDDWSEQALFDKALLDSTSFGTQTSAKAPASAQALATASAAPKPPGPAQRDTYGRQTRHTPTSGPHRGQAQILVWNSAHKLTQVRDQQTGQVLANYRYDSSGNRVSKSVAATSGTPSTTKTTGYLYDNAHRLLAHLDAQGKITRHYLYAGHRVYSILEGGHVYQVQTDWRGLPTQVSDETSQVVWAGQFDAWGHANEKVDANTAASSFDMPLRLAGQQYDPETGLHYNIHRYYDPAQGRYISPDPLGVADGDDRYAYVKGNPLGAIDPTGLFEIPFGALNGSDHYFVDMKVEPGDHGHGDILREAFWLYQKSFPNRFSQSIIDQIIVNNYQSDAENKVNGCLPLVDGVNGGGQCLFTNHFDNPNAGAGAPYQVKAVIDPKTGKTTYVSTGTFRSTYTNTHWIQDGIDDLNNARMHYGDFENNGASGADISQALGAFGRNSHALADFYAHSNWVDGTERGGCWFKIPLVGANQQGWIPTGLNQQDLWDGVARPDLYSGTVGLNELKGSFDKSTHSYWNKDGDSTQTDETEYTVDEQKAFNLAGKFYWVVEDYDSSKFDINDYKTGKLGGWESLSGLVPTNGLNKGDPIYVARPITNRHRMATYLAVQDTIREIDKLWNAAAGKTLGITGKTMQDAFSLNKGDLSAAGVTYQVLWAKDARP